MQQTQKPADVQARQIKSAPVAPRTPVELPIEQLAQVAGGAPKGAW